MSQNNADSTDESTPLVGFDTYKALKDLPIGSHISVTTTEGEEKRLTPVGTHLTTVDNTVAIPFAHLHTGVIYTLTYDRGLRLGAPVSTEGREVFIDAPIGVTAVDIEHEGITHRENE